MNSRPDLAELPFLGAGVVYQPGLDRHYACAAEWIDFQEVSPDTLCREMQVAGERRYGWHPEQLGLALERLAETPAVVHGLGLSIGSASGWDSAYLDLLDRFAGLQPFAWHSEHLGFTHVLDADGLEHHAGTLLPMPFSEASLDLLSPRIGHVRERYGRPFLIENTTHYLPGFETLGEYEEPEFLNALCDRSGCGLLLDLYNLYCNATNFGFDAMDALARINLANVVEMHVAGGASSHGFLMDVHSSTVPEGVWDMLRFAAPRAHNLKGVVYELLQEAAEVVSPEQLRDEMRRLHGCLNDGRRARDVAA